jgi:Domain of unknown function (DUF4055)
MAADNDIRFSRIPADALERWKVVADVIAGDQAVRSYLPYLNKDDRSEENSNRNAAYRAGAVLYTATSFTLAGMLGLAFRHEPKHDLPTPLAYLLKDADGAGVSVYQQSQAVLAHVLGPGRHGLYVDFSSALGRPVVKSYCADDIINWRTSNVGGKTVLSLVVLKERAEKIDEYAVQCVDQWREIWLADGVCKVRVWQLDADGNSVVVPVLDADGLAVDKLVLRSSKAPLDFIPFSFVGSQNNDTAIDESPMYGLSRINLAHFRNSADYEDSVFFVGQVQAWISGLDTEWRNHLEKSGGIYVGSRKPMLLPAGGAFGFAQAQPNMLAKEAMAHKEAQMVALGARLIDKAAAVKTATQAQGEREASTSILALCVSNVSEAYQTAIRWCARYLDLTIPDTAEDLYEINQDFASVPSDPQTITALVTAWQQGLLARSDVRAFFRRQGTVDPERSDEDIDADLAIEPPKDGSAIVPAGSEPRVAALLKPAPTAVAAPIASPPAPQPLDLSPIVAAIREGKPQPLDIAALVEMVKAAQVQPIAPQSVDMAPIADAMRAGMEAVSASLSAFGAAVAAMQPAAAPSITVPVQVDAPAPIDMTALAEAIKANGEAMAAALGAIKPALTLVQQRANTATIREADGSETQITLN